LQACSIKTNSGERRALAALLASTFLVALFLAAVNVAPHPAGAAAPTTPLRTRDIGSVPVTCNSEVFISSLNNDDDNDNGTPDHRETLPLKKGRRATVPENNLREFIFDVPEATRVYIAEVALIPSNDIAVGSRVRAYKDDKSTPFKFGDNQVPVTMYLEGKAQSPSANDIGFEYQYFKDDGSTVCGGFVQGTIVRADSSLAVATGKGTPFSRHHKMLITGDSQGTATVAPAGLVAPEWTYDAPGGTFSTPTELATDFTAPVTFTPAARMGDDRLRLTLTATATNPANQVIEANVPVNLTAARSLRLRGDAVRERPTGLMNAGRGRFDLFNWLVQYDILDQTEISIKESAYAGRQPQAQENIGSVLTSPIPEVQTQIGILEHSPTWTDQSDGVLSDRIKALDWSKDVIVVTNNGQRRFHSGLRSEGDILMHVAPPNTHIWELSVNGEGIVEATNNRFASTVIQVIGQGAQQINIRSRYRVVLP
jgi:hypothetical protein